MDMSLQEELYEHLSSFETSPILFVGSGLSRRYLGLEDWEGLLAKFSSEIDQKFGYFKSSSDGHLPSAASMLANEFKDIWWKSEKFKQNRDRYEDICVHSNSALKIEIAEYLKGLPCGEPTDPDLLEEVTYLKNANVDGVITTNWDPLMETIFPDYKVYVGQEGVIFNNFCGVGEIFKIHGCCSQPNSLTLTQEDYKGFSERYPYLSSKLLTFFVEHPVIFVGYSLADENIIEILESIGSCLSPANLEKLRDRIILVDWHPDCEEQISDSTHKIGDSAIPIKIIRTSSFKPVFKALASIKRRFPVKVLRRLKEHVFDLVLNNDPNGKIYVSNFEETQEQENLEVVFGVGAITKYQETGYKGITRYEVLRDVVFDNRNFDPAQVLLTAMPEFPASSYIPVFKYLSAAGRISDEGVIDTTGLCERVRVLSGYNQQSFANPGRVENIRNRMPEFDDGLHAFYQAHGVMEVVKHSAQQELNKDNVDELGKIIKKHFDEFLEKKHVPTAFGKLICLYDWLKYRSD
jgi:hypothetical protein